MQRVRMGKYPVEDMEQLVKDLRDVHFLMNAKRRKLKSLLQLFKNTYNNIQFFPI